MRSAHPDFLKSIRIISASLLVLACGCKTETGERDTKNDDESSKSEVVVEFPDGDPSVSPEEGGPGFTGEGWQTSNPGPVGDSRAIKGGSILSYIPNWPENLRIYGTGANTYLNSIVGSLCYESLCSLHPDTLETVPALASHWKISDDNLTFTFRINPQTHWADGRPVVAEDVVATYRLLQDDSLKDPMSKQSLQAINEPKAISKYIVEVECKEKHWRNFLTFISLTILPAHEISELTGEKFIEDYQFAYPTVSGPYYVERSDIKKNESITLTRRKDYWGLDDEANVGLYNFDKIRFVVNNNQRNAFDQACNGELDFHAVYTAKWWIEDLVGDLGDGGSNTSPLQQVNLGHLVAQKIYTLNPEGIQGIAFNMRKKPFDDVRVRKAFAHLYDRRTMVDKFAYGEYEPLGSYYPGITASPENELVEYDPEEAVRLLSEAGFTERDDDGVLMKDGQRLVVKITYRTPGFEKYFTTLTEACRKVGVEVKLNLIDPTAHWKVLQERTFDVAASNLSGSLFPNPQTHWYSKMADVTGSNNFAGFQSAEADKIIEQYNQEFDMSKRQDLLRQLDAEIFRQHPYALEWYIPCQRIIYWNKFGMRDSVFSKFGDWREVFTTWWIDPEKEKALQAARESGASLPAPDRILRPWSANDSEVAATSDG